MITATELLVIPDIGDFSGVTVIEVPVKVGQEIEAEATLVTLETDKATLEIPSAYSGKILELTVKPGDKISQGDIIGKIAVQGQSEKVEQTEHNQKPVIPEKPLIPEKPVLIPDRVSAVSVHAGPGVRQFARALGIDLSQIVGTGPKGRIVQTDLAHFLKSQTSTIQTKKPDINFEKFGPIERLTRSRIQNISAKHLHQSWIQIPHVTQFEQADITELEQFRKQNVNFLQDQDPPIKLTILVFLMKGVISALKTYPDFNSSFGADTSELILKKYYHLGVAVDTENGLVVPVIRNVDQKSVFELALELKTLSDRARAGTLKGSDLQGGSFTISSLGGIGGTYFTPIINAPEVAILGVSRAEKRVIERAPGQFESRLFLPFSVSYDHRAIDGAAAARFVVYLKNMLEDIRKLILV